MGLLHSDYLRATRRAATVYAILSLIYAMLSSLCYMVQYRLSARPPAMRHGGEVWKEKTLQTIKFLWIPTYKYKRARSRRIFSLAGPNQNIGILNPSLSIAATLVAKFQRRRPLQERVKISGVDRTFSHFRDSSHSTRFGKTKNLSQQIIKQP
jgi:hypothetical protein